MSSSSDVFSKDLIFGEAFCLIVFPYLPDTGLSVFISDGVTVVVYHLPQIPENIPVGM